MSYIRRCRRELSCQVCEGKVPERCLLGEAELPNNYIYNYIICPATYCVSKPIILLPNVDMFSKWSLVIIDQFLEAVDTKCHCEQ